MLTLKTKEKFREFLNSHKEYQEYKCRFEKLPLVCQQALVVEFFESIGFHIGRDLVDNYWLENSTYYERLGLDGYDYIPKIKNLSKAIEKANEIFNLNNE